jgi:hypothetical protein
MRLHEGFPLVSCVPPCVPFRHRKCVLQCAVRRSVIHALLAQHRVHGAQRTQPAAQMVSPSRCRLVRTCRTLVPPYLSSLFVAVMQENTHNTKHTQHTRTHHNTHTTHTTHTPRPSRHDFASIPASLGKHKNPNYSLLSHVSYLCDSTAVASAVCFSFSRTAWLKRRWPVPFALAVPSCPHQLW